MEDTTATSAPDHQPSDGTDEQDAGKEEEAVSPAPAQADGQLEEGESAEPVVDTAKIAAESEEGESATAAGEITQKTGDVEEPANGGGTTEAAPVASQRDPQMEAGADVKRPSTDQSSSSAKKEKKKDKKNKRKSRSNDGGGGKRKSSRTGTGGAEQKVVTGQSGKCLEVILLSLFHTSDPQETGFIDASLFWEILESNLQLSSEQITHLKAFVQLDRAGQVAYGGFCSQAADVIASLYSGEPARPEHWVEMTSADGTLAVNYNKQTGEAMERAESGLDLFIDLINDLYRQADPENQGYVTWDMFLQILQSSEMTPYLAEEDYRDVRAHYDTIADGKASYGEFCSIAREVILRVYRAKDPSESPWCKISSEETGEVWFNKFTGETHLGIQAGDREHEIAFINEAYAHVQEVNFELDQYKEQYKTLTNQLALATEEQEILEAQLYETGQALDEANLELVRKENETEQMKATLANKDKEISLLENKLADMESLRKRLTETEEELQRARETVANRDQSISDRDTNIMSLQRQADAVTDELKTAHGEKDAQESALNKLQHQLKAEQKRLKDYEKAVPELEEQLSVTKEELQNTRKTLEEKTALLAQTRKHLKHSRERNMDLEKEMEKLELTQDRLQSVASEVRTLKTFLTTKTAIIEKHKKELRETRLRLAELEEKDGRRAVILADVLEKTARQYQQQLGHGSSGLSPKGKGRQSLPQTPHVDESRPYSAPALPPDGSGGEPVEETDFPGGMVKTFTTSQTGPSLTYQHRQDLEGPRTGKMGAAGTKVKNRSRTVPKLPPIHKSRSQQHKTKTFTFSTDNDLRKERRLRDAMLLDHTPSNPHCSCKLCTLNASVVGHRQQRPETGLTGMTAKTAGLPGYQGETDVRELALAEQLRIGQRVVVRMKKSEFDLEPTKLTGIIKYVGKIDSEYVDHRIYVGVKLDDAVGDTDGLVKTKRYFTCPPKHGKIVRITNIVAVLPNKSVFYRPLQDMAITKRSPYTTVQKKAAKVT